MAGGGSVTLNNDEFDASNACIRTAEDRVTGRMRVRISLVREI